jgi:putative MATE family efflux protein
LRDRNQNSPANSDITIANQFGKDLTQGSIPLNLLKLAWPMIITNSLNMLGPTIDVIWVGKLGSAAVAGVGVAGIAARVVMSAMMGLGTGLRAMVARFTGARKEEESNRTIAQGLVIGAVLGIFLSVIGIFLAEPILLLLKLSDDVVRQGADYLRIVFASNAVMFLRMMAESGMQSAGDPVTPMKITIFFRFLHIVMCPFFVFGWWIFPQLGVIGAAVTNLISQSIGLVLSIWVLSTGRTHLHVSFKEFRIDFGLIWRIVKIGIPASIMGVQMALGGFVLINFLSPFGTNAVAAHTIWQSVDMLLMMPIWGLGMAAGILAGQNLGAGKPERAVKGGWIAVLMSEAIMFIFVVVMFFWAEGVVRIFNSEPGLVAIGATFLRIASVGYLLLGFYLVFQNCISGAGDTILPMIISLVGTWLLQIPLAHFLPKVANLGVYGVRWAIVISMFMGATAYTIYFVMGRWKHKKV